MIWIRSAVIMSIGMESNWNVLEDDFAVAKEKLLA